MRRRDERRVLTSMYGQYHIRAIEVTEASPMAFILAAKKDREGRYLTGWYRASQSRRGVCGFAVINFLAGPFQTEAEALA